jgi:diguanylate cyclase (GGDEF)-like protein
VKKAWDVAGRPARNPQLARLGTRLNAQLRVLRGSHPRPVTTIGKTRSYSFATRRGSTLRVGLSTQRSGDALSKGLLAALTVGLAGVLLLAALLSAVLRSAVAPLRAMKRPLDDLRARNAELEAQIGRDALTGLLSGPHVRHALEVEVKRANREMIPLTLVLLDLDKLTLVNEAHGKQAGDRVLRGMVSRVGAGLRETDVFGRVAGGEFALILPKAGAEHAETAIARAREAVADVVLEGFTLTFSAGYACFPADAREAESLTQAAEGALKVAKRDGAATRRFDPTEVSVRHQEGDRLRGPHALQDAAQALPRSVVQPRCARGDGSSARSRSDPARAGGPGPARRHVPVAQPEPVDPALARGGCGAAAGSDGPGHRGHRARARR